MTPGRARQLRRSATVTGLLLGFGAGVVVGGGVGGGGGAPGLGAGALDGAERVSTRSAAQQPPGVLDEAARRIAETGLEPVDRQVLEDAAIRAMLARTQDRWAGYHGPAEYDAFTDSLEGRYTGVGLWLRDAGAALEVTSVRQGSPASAVGLRAGDLVLAVDGAAVSGPGGVGAATERLRGPAGTPVTLTVRSGPPAATGGPAETAGAPPAEAVRQVRLVREQVATDDVQVERLRGGVVLVRVAAVSRGVGRGVREAVVAAGEAGVVLDLRGNAGGLLSEAVEVASAFLDEGPVASYERRGSATQYLEALADGEESVPLVVLVDSGTASAAEVVVGALQDRGRAVVVGSRTYGKGAVQEPVRLGDGSALTLTVGRYRTPAGRSLDGVGIDPDLVVADGAPAEVAEQRALEVLDGLLAAAPAPDRPGERPGRPAPQQGRG